MSLAFNDTTSYKGIVQIYEKEIGVPRGTVSGDTDKLKELTADVNVALDDFVTLAIKSSGTWKWDDSNQTDYPVITTNLVSGQRDYSFTTDGGGNLILDIYKVFVANSAGVFVEMYPVDVETGTDVPTVVAGSGQLYTSLSSFTDGQNRTGIPTRYDKQSNALFLDPIPNYNYTNGLKMYVNREASYFVYTDTTKKPGIPGLFHRYLALKPALDYARRNELKNYQLIQAEVLRMEGNESAGIKGAIQEYFSERPRDEVRAFSLTNENTR